MALDAARRSAYSPRMTAPFERTRGEYVVSADPAKMDLAAIHAYLSRAYWCEGIPRATLDRAVANSLCFAVLHGTAQVGFARVVTDSATFAYLCDVYILEAHRGRGLSKLLMECVIAHPQLQGLRRFSLATRDTHGLYRQFGFHDLADPTRYLEILRADIYKQP
jgi:GNAT superfamily N-acetyltransferase